VALTFLPDYGSYGAGGSGLGSSSFRDDRRGYEEYNAGDDEISTPTTTQPRTQNAAQTPTKKSSAPQPPPAPVEDLLGGFGDEDTTATNTGLGGLSMNKALPAVSNNTVAIDGWVVDFLSGILLNNLFSDDDFADFQAAPVQPVVQPALTTGNNVPTVGVKPTLREMLNTTPAKPPVNQAGSLFGQVQPAAFGTNMAGGIGMGGMHRPSQSFSSSSQLSTPMMPSTQVQPPNLFGGAAPTKPTSSTMLNRTNTLPSTQTKPTPGSSANFDDLWSMSLGAAVTKPSGTTVSTGAGKSIKDLEKEKAMSGLWGGQKPAGGAGAFGSFGNSNSGGGDDLLL
jgi:epsin